MTEDVLPKCVAVDANFLIAYVDPQLPAEDRERLDYFIECLDKAKSKLIIPMPAIAEYLVGADVAGLLTLEKLEKRAFVEAAPFGRAEAYECALIDRSALGGGDKKDGESHWQKIKIDRQIVAIGKARGATLFISSDSSVRNNALRLGLKSKTIQELPLPDRARQTNLQFVAEKEKQ